MGGNFDFEVDDFAPAQLSHYFSDLIASHSWSAVKLDLYGSLEFTEYWPHNSG
jgi:hypothetical protein